jgi:hypothetical protein
MKKEIVLAIEDSSFILTFQQKTFVVRLLETK